MTNTEKKQLIEIVHAEIAKLEDKIEGLKEYTAPIAPDDAIGRISRMDAINNKSIFEKSMRNSRERLSHLNYVLQTINEADFGLCAKCHQSISFERLKIRPEIKLCANCFQR
ncbi:MAG: TraR/DksA C4-type zinc finger protein [Bacteroidales bacterium]